MIARLLAQLILTTTLLTALPYDGALLEATAGLPVAGERNASMVALQLVSSGYGFPRVSLDGPTKIDSLSLGIVTSAQSVLVLDVES